MVMADPWQLQSPNVASTEHSMRDLEEDLSQEQKSNILAFEDNFVEKEFAKLPDSDEYLSTLERKLARIQNKKSSSNPNREMIQNLSALRNDRMRQLLSRNAPPQSSELTPGDDLDISSQVLSDNEYSAWMMQRLFPERQALSAEELAQLLRFDTLAILHERLSEYGVERDNHPGKKN